MEEKIKRIFALEELINYSKELMKKSEITKTNQVINHIFSSKMEIVKSIKALIESENFGGVEVLLRSYIEYFFQLMYILEDSLLMQDRALCYNYFYLKNMLTKYEGSEILEAIIDYHKKYGNECEEFEKKKLELEIKKILSNTKKTQTLLDSKEFENVRDEIEKFKNVQKFYQCFLGENCEKINSLKDLAKHLSLSNYYLLDYSALSRNVHGSNNGKINLEVVHRIIFNIADDVFKSYKKNILSEDEVNASKKIYQIKKKYNLTLNINKK